MGLHHSPKIATDGIVLCLDAANSRSATYGENLLIYSNNFENAGWSKTNVTVSANVTTSPDGNVNAESSVTTTAGGAVGQSATITAGSTITASIFAKAFSSNFVRFELGGLCSCWFNLSTGAVASNNAGSGNVLFSAKSIQSVGNGWYRCILTVTTTTITSLGCLVYATDTDGNTSSINSSVYLYGAQLQTGSNATTYKPTTNIAYASNSSWLDLTNTGNNGTLVNAPLHTSDNGSYVTFNYLNFNIVSFANNSSVQFTGIQPYTLEAWVYPTRNPGANNWTGIFDREDASTGSRDGYNLYFLGSGTTTTYFTTERYIGGVGQGASVAVDSTLSLNKWQHIVSVFDTKDMFIYRNGTLAARTNNFSIANSSINFTKTLDIGRRGGNYFDGRIATARIYKRSLSSDEIKQNFNALRGRYGV